MSKKIIPTTAKKLIRFFEKEGFEKDRQSGSHLTLEHSDERTVTLPVHTGKDIGKGLLKKILKDANYTVEKYNQLQ